MSDDKNVLPRRQRVSGQGRKDAQPAKAKAAELFNGATLNRDVEQERQQLQMEQQRQMEQLRQELMEIGKHSKTESSKDSMSLRTFETGESKNEKRGQVLFIYEVKRETEKGRRIL